MWGDRFMDFFNVNKMASGLDPYITGGSSYPPLAMIIAYIVGLFIPGTSGMTAAEVRNQGPFGKYVLVGMYALCILLISVFAWRRIWKQARKAREESGIRESLAKPKRILHIAARILLLGAVSLGIGLTAPMIYAIDRGNYLSSVRSHRLVLHHYGKNDYAASVFPRTGRVPLDLSVVLVSFFSACANGNPCLSVSARRRPYDRSTLLFKADRCQSPVVREKLMNFSGGVDPYHSIFTNAIGTKASRFDCDPVRDIFDKHHIASLTTVVYVRLLVFVIVLCLWKRDSGRQILY
jgi:multisubunit Na+/H+ antiporter MnhG subunit